MGANIRARQALFTGSEAGATLDAELSRYVCHPPTVCNVPEPSNWHQPLPWCEPSGSATAGGCRCLLLLLLQVDIVGLFLLPFQLPLIEAIEEDHTPGRAAGGQGGELQSNTATLC